MSHLPSPKGVARHHEQEEVGRWFPNFTFQMSAALLCVILLRMPHPSGGLNYSREAQPRASGSCFVPLLATAHESYHAVPWQEQKGKQNRESRSPILASLKVDSMLPSSVAKEIVSAIYLK